MTGSMCQMQSYDGKGCNRVAVKDGKCFWHSDIRKTDENVRRHFPSYTNLKELITQERPNLERADFTRDVLIDFDFREYNLRGAFFDKADLRGSLLVRANLESAYLNEANLENADLTGANLTKAGMARCNLRYACLDQAVLQNTRLLESNLSFASLRRVVLRSTKLHFVNLYRADLTDATFSNREAQLKFCNTDEAIFEDFYEKRIAIWIREGKKVDVLQVVEFFQKKLPAERLQAWLRLINATLEEKLVNAQRERNLHEIADLLEFVTRLYKITGALPRALALPEPKPAFLPEQGREVLRITASLQENSIVLPELHRLSHDLHEVLVAAAKVVFPEAAEHRTIPARVIFLSLQSPLVIEILVAAGLPSALLKFISWFQNFVLKNREIEKAELDIEQTKLEITKQKIEMEKQLIERDLRLIELQRKIHEQHAGAKADDVDQLTLSLRGHITWIREADSFTDYRISNEREERIIKTPVSELKRPDERRVLEHQEE